MILAPEVTVARLRRRYEEGSITYYFVYGWVLTNLFCTAAKHRKTCNLKHYLIYYSFLTGFGCTNNFKLVSSDNKLT